MVLLSQGEHNEKMKIFGIKDSRGRFRGWVLHDFTSSNSSHLSPQKHIGMQTKIDHLKVKQA